MMYAEIKGDLFSVDESYYLAHCISADFALGAGIAVQFAKRFDMKRLLLRKYPDFLSAYDYQLHFCNKSGCCILEGRVFNLVTKRLCYEKPTYESLYKSLRDMRDICVSNGIRKVAMPAIGCGLDGLSWDEVSRMVKAVFCSTDVAILVVML